MSSTDTVGNAPIEPVVTTAVWLLVAGLPGPAALEAVTRTRRVEPASAATTVYEVPVAVAMSLQLAPAVSQRVHWRA